MNKQKGFTLIELVVVVVLLGILAVNAIPKMLDLTDQAKQANIEGMAGGFATGISLARAQWEAEARTRDAAGNNQVTYDGVVLKLTNENTNTGVRPGYVVGLTDGSDLGAGFDETNCAEIWNNILQQPPMVSTAINDVNDNNQNIQYLVDTTDGGNANNNICVYHLVSTLNQDNNGDYISAGGVTTIGNNFTYDPSNSSVEININNN